MSLKVQIDHPKEIYSPGEFIVGKVSCVIKDPDYVEIKVKFFGEECIYHVQTGTHQDRASNFKNNFLETKNTAIRSGYLGIGHYEFRFNFTLPRIVPSSYNGKHGHVKFFIRARLFDKIKKIDEDKTELNVFSPIDLNYFTGNLSLEPSTLTDEFVVIPSLWCLSEKVEMDVKLERNSYTVGDIVNVAVLLKNDSNLKIVGVAVELFLEIHAKVSSSKLAVLVAQELLVSEQDNNATSRRRKSYMFGLKIPSNASIPNFSKCSILSQSASLMVSVMLEKSSKPDLKVQADLVLGHIPLKKSARKHFIDNSEEHVIIYPLPYTINNALPTEFMKLSTSNTPARFPIPYQAELTEMPRLPQNSLENKLPYPIHVGKATNRLNLLDSKTDVQPPYPIENHFLGSSKNSCPYPVTLPEDAAYPIEDSKLLVSYSSVANVAISKESCSYPVQPGFISAPYPPGKQLIYPEMGFSSVTSMPTSSHLPFPILDSIGFHGSPPQPNQARQSDAVEGNGIQPSAPPLSEFGTKSNAKSKETEGRLLIELPIPLQ